MQLIKEMPKTVKDAVALTCRLEVAHSRLQTERSAERLQQLLHLSQLDKLTLQVKKLADEVTTLKELPERRASWVANGPWTSKPPEVVGPCEKELPSVRYASFKWERVGEKGLPSAPHVKTKEQPGAVVVDSTETSSATWTRGLASRGSHNGYVAGHRFCSDDTPRGSVE